MCIVHISTFLFYEHPNYTTSPAITVITAAASRATLLQLDSLCHHLTYETSRTTMIEILLFLMTMLQIVAPLFSKYFTMTEYYFNLKQSPYFYVTCKFLSQSISSSFLDML